VAVLCSPAHASVVRCFHKEAARAFWGVSELFSPLFWYSFFSPFLGMMLSLLLQPIGICATRSTTPPPPFPLLTFPFPLLPINPTHVPLQEVFFSILSSVGVLLFPEVSTRRYTIHLADGSFLQTGYPGSSLLPDIFSFSSSCLVLFSHSFRRIIPLKCPCFLFSVV